MIQGIRSGQNTEKMMHNQTKGNNCHEVQNPGLGRTAQDKEEREKGEEEKEEKEKDEGKGEEIKLTKLFHPLLQCRYYTTKVTFMLQTKLGALLCEITIYKRTCHI